MEMTGGAGAPAQENDYSVWAIPPEDVRERLKKLMGGLRSEFGGPEIFQPHITVVGAISLTEQDALEKFRSACEGLKAYQAKTDRIVTGAFPSQCLYLLFQSTPEVMDASAHCCRHFGYKRSNQYMPHLSLLYGTLTNEEKRKAKEKTHVLDESIDGLNFQISRLALWITDRKDNGTLETWKLISECSLSPD
ncbi:protein 2'3'-CYCLIC-NUCLEOTIDE 3'-PHOSPHODIESTERASE [Salix purpurea]|uniref:Protein 2'3'-CYCLIC-NUCLEOTIDE 3'-PHOSPHODIESTERASE n=1 Tax=Salix purpurea TaxID=77065 RepID=A0A9Q0VTI3_SALPP|nr:protein 2'3'-CYCLIC-NUCLEOTIDE 3'-PHOSPHODIESTERASE [Salix purpurea]